MTRLSDENITYKERRKMNEVQIFDNPEFGKIRTVVIDNEPWFVGKDIAQVLGYTNTRKALADHVDDEDKGVTKCDTLGGMQELTVINESGMYSLIFGSKLESAKRFKHWVTHDVLPALRKTGRYSVKQDSDIDAIINGLVAAQRVIRQKNNEIRLLQSQQEITKEDIYVCDMADKLNRCGLFAGGTNTFYRWNREHGFVLKYNTFPTEKAIRLGILRVDVRRNYSYNGVVIPRKRTVVTPKGQEYYVDVFTRGVHV